jgi:hypothetical protein
MSFAVKMIGISQKAKTTAVSGFAHLISKKHCGWNLFDLIQSESQLTSQ